MLEQESFLVRTAAGGVSGVSAVALRMTPERYVRKLRFAIFNLRLGKGLQIEN
jgi:hypothetical protein